MDNAAPVKTEQSKPNGESPKLKLVIRRPNKERPATSDEIRRFVEAFNKSRGK